MMHLAMLALLAAFFGLFFAFLSTCERIVSPRQPAR